LQIRHRGHLLKKASGTRGEQKKRQCAHCLCDEKCVHSSTSVSLSWYKRDLFSKTHEAKTQIRRGEGLTAGVKLEILLELAARVWHSSWPMELGNPRSLLAFISTRPSRFRAPKLCGNSSRRLELRCKTSSCDKWPNFAGKI